MVFSKSTIMLQYAISKYNRVCVCMNVCVLCIRCISDDAHDVCRMQQSYSFVCILGNCFMPFICTDLFRPKYIKFFAPGRIAPWYMVQIRIFEISTRTCLGGRHQIATEANKIPIYTYTYTQSDVASNHRIIIIICSNNGTAQPSTIGSQLSHLHTQTHIYRFTVSIHKPTTE